MSDATGQPVQAEVRDGEPEPRPAAGAPPRSAAGGRSFVITPHVAQGDRPAASDDRLRRLLAGMLARRIRPTDPFAGEKQSESVDGGAS